MGVLTVRSTNHWPCAYMYNDSACAHRDVDDFILTSCFLMKTRSPRLTFSRAERGVEENLLLVT